MTMFRGKDSLIGLAYLIESASFLVSLIFETPDTISIAITFVLAGSLGFVATRIAGISTRSGALTGGSIVFVGAILGFLWSALGGGASGVKPQDALAGYAGMFLVTILYFFAAAFVAFVFALLGNRLKNARVRT